MTVNQAEVIMALAENGLREHRAAQKMYRHRSTVEFHVGNIKKQTGLDPLDFYDMQKLLPMAKRVLVEYSLHKQQQEERKHGKTEHHSEA